MMARVKGTEKESCPEEIIGIFQIQRIGGGGEDIFLKKMVIIYTCVKIFPFDPHLFQFGYQAVKQL